jgi:hypothetical protein
MDRHWERLGPFVLMALAVKVAIGFGACTQDDAFISFRYAENLLAGHGLVFNPGEWVEGISNLSWTISIAAGMSLGLDPVVFTILAGLISVIGLVFVLVQGAKAMGLRGLAALLPVVFILADPLFLLEAVEGLETAAYALVILVGTLLALGEVARGDAHTRSSLCFAVAIWTRPEAPLIIGAVHLGLWLSAGGERSAQLRRSIVGTWPIVLAFLALELTRFGLYGEWLPNTYFAKTGAGAHAIPRGLRYWSQHLSDHALLWALMCVSLLRCRGKRAVLVLGVPVLLMTAYVVWVGGDFKPTGRFFAPVFPLMALLAAGGFVHLVGSTRSVVRMGTVFAAVGWSVWVVPDLFSRAEAQAVERHANLEARKLVGDWLATQVPADTVLAIHSAGVIPYYAGLPTIDMWGLSDKHIARTSPATMGTGMAGHEKTDPDYVFAQGPEIFLPEDKVFVLRPWDLSPNPSFPSSFASHYRQFHVPIGGGWLNGWVRKDWVVPWEQ